MNEDRWHGWRRILADENMNRIFSKSWKHIRNQLLSKGYIIYQFPKNLSGKGISDPEVLNLVIQKYDGIITEDRDFIESHRSSFLQELVITHKKIVLYVQRAPPTAERYEVRIFEYKEKNGCIEKREILRDKVSPRVISPNTSNLSLSNETNLLSLKSISTPIPLSKIKKILARQITVSYEYTDTKYLTITIKDQEGKNYSYQFATKPRDEINTWSYKSTRTISKGLFDELYTKFFNAPWLIKTCFEGFRGHGIKIKGILEEAHEYDGKEIHITFINVYEPKELVNGKKIVEVTVCCLIT